MGLLIRFYSRRLKKLFGQVKALSQADARTVMESVEIRVDQDRDRRTFVHIETIKLWKNLNAYLTLDPRTLTSPAVEALIRSKDFSPKTIYTTTKKLEEIQGMINAYHSLGIQSEMIPMLQKHLRELGDLVP